MATAARTNCLTSMAIILMVAGTLIVKSSSQPVSANCHGSTPTFISDCSTFVKKGGQQTNPSADCCHVVKAVGAGCLCSLLSGSVANAIDINKAVFVARSCGLTLQPGSKCGDRDGNGQVWGKNLMFRVKPYSQIGLYWRILISTS